jgi:hypothetical protein
MNPIMTVVSVPKKVVAHVYSHRGRYAFVAGMLTSGYIAHNFGVTDEALAFIEQKGLTNEFYAVAE